MSTAPTLDWVAVPSHLAEGPAEVRHKDGWLVCEVSADSYARLIAAAPELLEALRLARTALVTSAMVIGDFEAAKSPFIRDFDILIAKAEGHS